MEFKRIAILYIVSFTILTRTIAQDIRDSFASNHKQLFTKIEFLIGPSMVRVHESEQYDKYGVTKISYVVGLGISHSMSNHWGLNFKIFYEQKGFKQTAIALIPPDYYNDPPTTNLPPIRTEITGNLNNDYISLIFLPEYSFGKSHQLHLSTGPYLSQLLKSSISVTDVQQGSVKRNQVLDQTETYKDYDYGLSAFAGYDFFLLKNIELSVKVYYSYGLMNVVELEPGLTPMKNNSLALLIAIGVLK